MEQAGVIMESTSPSLLKGKESTWIQLFASWYKEDRNAIKLSLDLLEFLNLWDDIIDGEELDSSLVNSTMKKVVYDIPRNPLFQAGLPEITSVLKVVIDQWEVANSFEESGEELPKAYMLRAQVFQVFCLIAELVGGEEWKRHIAPSIWKAYGETYEEYEEEMKNA